MHFISKISKCTILKVNHAKIKVEFENRLSSLEILFEVSMKIIREIIFVNTHTYFLVLFFKVYF